MSYQPPEVVLFSTWVCKPCEVGGVDQGDEPECWFCGGPVFVTGQNRRSVDPSTALKRQVYR